MGLDYKILLDTPADGAMALGFDQLADAFTQIIRTSEPRFAIGLFGTWGSGKTTLMQGIKTRLDGQTDALVWFDAWRYEREPHLIVPMLDTIREAVLEWSRTQTPGGQQAAYSLARTIGHVTASLVAGLSFKFGVPGVADVTFKANDALKVADDFDALDTEARTPRSTYHASFTALRQAFAAFHAAGAQRIVVFIDDLDRCLPDGALEVLESMKLFFDMTGFVFVVGLDATVVERFVEHRYRELLAANAETPPISGEAYLRKIFQVPFGLRPVTGGQIEDFVEATILAAGMPADQGAELRGVVLPFLRELVTESGFNPRELKRFINAYTIQLQIRAAAGRTNPAEHPVILALQTIAFREDWAGVQAGLLALRGAMVSAIGTFGNNGSTAQFEPYLGGPPPGTFLRFLGDPATGGALVRFAQAGGDIDAFLFEGTSFSDERGTRHVEAFEALGAVILSVQGKLRLLEINMESDQFDFEMEAFSSELTSLRDKWSSFGLVVGADAIAGLTTTITDIHSALKGHEDLPAKREAARTRLLHYQEVLRATMFELQRDFRAKT